MGLPRPAPPDAQPCLSLCALLVRQTAPVLMLRARAQRSHRPHARPCSTRRRPHPRAHCFRVPALPCRDTRADSAHIDWAGSRAQQSSPAALSSGSTLALQHTCFAGTHALQHTIGQMHGLLLDLYPYLQERGWDGYRPLNGCSQGLVVRGISPPEPCLYTCHTKVFSKVSNSLPIHQYFPAASPYGAQPGGWIGNG